MAGAMYLREVAIDCFICFGGVMDGKAHVQVLVNPSTVSNSNGAMVVERCLIFGVVETSVATKGS